MPRSEREVLVEYLLRDVENLSLALSIAESRDDICTRVIADFVAAVAVRLCETLGDTWAVRAGTLDEVDTSYARFMTAEYLAHPGHFTVMLGADEKRYPKKAYFAVRSDVSGKHPSIKVELDVVAKGYSSEVSIWYRYLDDRYLSWGSETVTTWLYRKGESVEYIAQYMEKLAHAVERGLAAPAEPLT